MKSRRRLLLILALALLVTTHVWVMPHFCWGMIEYEAWLTTRGLLASRDYFEFIAPGGPWLTAPFFCALGPTYGAVLVETLAINVLVALLVFRAATRLFSAEVGMIALWLWVIWSPTFRPQFLWFELILTPFLIEAMTQMDLALRGRGARRALFICGALLGVATLIKQHGVFTLIAATAAWTLLRRRGETRSCSWGAGMICLALGATSTLVVPLAFLAYHAGAGELMYSLVAYPLVDQQVSRWNEIPILLLIYVVVFLYSYLMILFAWVIVSAARGGRAGMRRAILLGLWASAALGHAAHDLRIELLYPSAAFAVMASAFVVRSGTQAISAGVRTGSRRRVALSGMARAVTTAILIPVLVVPTAAYFRFHYRLIDTRYRRVMDLTSYNAGLWVRDHTSPHRRLFVFGAPAAYFGALRLPATRYLNMEPSERGIRGLEEGIIASLSADPAAVVIYDRRPHVPWDKLHRDAAWRHNKDVERFILENYRVVTELPGDRAVMVRKENKPDHAPADPGATPELTGRPSSADARPPPHGSAPIPMMSENLPDSPAPISPHQTRSSQ